MNIDARTHAETDTLTQGHKRIHKHTHSLTHTLIYIHTHKQTHAHQSVYMLILLLSLSPVEPVDSRPNIERGQPTRPGSVCVCVCVCVQSLGSCVQGLGVRITVW